MSTVLPQISARRIDTPPVCLITLTGEHDLSTRPDVEVVLTDAVGSGDPVIVDLQPATFADSSILDAIIRAGNAAGRRGLAVVLPGDGEVRRLFDLVGARAVLLTFPTLRLAVEWCYPSAQVQHSQDEQE